MNPGILVFSEGGAHFITVCDAYNAHTPKKSLSALHPLCFPPSAFEYDAPVFEYCSGSKPQTENVQSTSTANPATKILRVPGCKILKNAHKLSIIHKPKIYESYVVIPVASISSLLIFEVQLEVVPQPSV